MIGSIEGREKTTTGFWQVEESKGTVANGVVFDVKALG